MKNKAILIVAGEPNSVFLEIFFKSLKNNIFKKPIILIVSKELLTKQMKQLKFNFKINLLNRKSISFNLLDNKKINMINVDYKFKKKFDKISENSNTYIENCFDTALTLLKTNKISVPKVTVNEQADLMRKDALMRIGHTEENAGDDLFPIDSFMENAGKRVKLDLLFSELIKHFEITVTKENVDAYIERESTKYKDSEQFKQWVENQPQQLDQFKMIVLEEQLVEKLENALKSKGKVIKFSELSNK